MAYFFIAVVVPVLLIINLIFAMRRMWIADPSSGVWVAKTIGWLVASIIVWFILWAITAECAGWFKDMRIH